MNKIDQKYTDLGYLDKDLVEFLVGKNFLVERNGDYKIVAENWSLCKDKDVESFNRHEHLVFMLDNAQYSFEKHGINPSKNQLVRLIKEQKIGNIYYTQRPFYKHGGKNKSKF